MRLSLEACCPEAALYPEGVLHLRHTWRVSGRAGKRVLHTVQCGLPALLCLNTGFPWGVKIRQEVTHWVFPPFKKKKKSVLSPWEHITYMCVRPLNVSLERG